MTTWSKIAGLNLNGSYSRNAISLKLQRRFSCWRRSTVNFKKTVFLPVILFASHGLWCLTSLSVKSRWPWHHFTRDATDESFQPYKNALLWTSEGSSSSLLLEAGHHDDVMLLVTGNRNSNHSLYRFIKIYRQTHNATRQHGQWILNLSSNLQAVRLDDFWHYGSNNNDSAGVSSARLIRSETSAIIPLHSKQQSPLGFIRT